jgi:CDP-paratose 2-epimerase
MKTILVTGSSGLIGSESVKFFINKGFSVVGLDNKYKKNKI